LITVNAQPIARRDSSFSSLLSACAACIVFLHLLRKSRYAGVHPTVMAGHVPIGANISTSCTKARPGWATAAKAKKDSTQKTQRAANNANDAGTCRQRL
jgi:hypothetical protein